jgi:uncharacterized membrane protein YedE/YeeE
VTLLYISLGTVFGFLLSRSGAADYSYIQAMFLFEDFQLYGIIGTAVVLTAPALWLLKRGGRTAVGRPLEVELKPLHRGNVVGGLLFGVGWSLAGALAGAGLFGAFYRRWQSALDLPPIIVGTGEG